MRSFAKLAAGVALALTLGVAADAGRAQAPVNPPHSAGAPAAPRAGGPLAPGTSIPPAELEAFVDGVVRTAMANDHIAGAAIAVVQNGQVVLKKGYGFSKLNPATPVDPDRTLFRLASISKTFTWITLMKDVEAGHIRLTAPINLYLPEKLQVKEKLHWWSRDFSQPVRVRDLLTHSAGFEDRALGQLFEKNPARIRPLAEYLRQERPRRVREAGATPVYSNYGAALAGEAVSNVDGHPYQDIVESEIIRPLALNRTTFREPYPARTDLPAPMPADLAADISTGYRWAGGSYNPQSFEYVSQAAPAGALSSTAGDMARYMEVILGGGQLDGSVIYNADTAKGFRTTTQSSAPGVNGFDNGFMEFSLPGGFRGQGHEGDTLWFHSSLVTVPNLGLGVFVTTNTDTGVALAAELPLQIVGRFYAPAQETPRSGSPDLVGQRSVYAGTYLNERRTYGGLEKFVRMLVGETRVTITKDGRLLTDGDGVIHAWTPEGAPDHFRQVDGPAVMAFDVENGRARHWFPASGTTVFDRIGPLEQIPVLAGLAGLTVLASIATIVGLFTRDRREFRQSTTQRRAGMAQTTIAVLWLIAMMAFGLWALVAGDIGKVMYGWPAPLLLVAQACAIVASLLAAGTIGMSPWVWSGGRRLDSWTSWRKLRFTASTVIYGAFSFVLLWWGALEPWSR